MGLEAFIRPHLTLGQFLEEFVAHKALHGHSLTEGNRPLGPSCFHPFLASLPAFTVGGLSLPGTCSPVPVSVPGRPGCVG